MLGHESLPELANRAYDQYFSYIAQAHGELCPCDLCAHYRQEYKINGVKRYGIVIPPRRRFLERQDDGLGPFRGLAWVAIISTGAAMVFWLAVKAWHLLWLWQVL